MTTPRTDRDRALSHVQTVHDLRRTLEREYLRDNPNRPRIADLHASIGVNLKLAAVHAALAQAGAVDDLRAELVELRRVPA